MRPRIPRSAAGTGKAGAAMRERGLAGPGHYRNFGSTLSVKPRKDEWLSGAHIR